MARFKFRLDFMISLRKRKEEEAAVRLAKRLASIAELEEQINSLHLRLSEIADELSEKGRAGRLNGPLLLMYSEYQQKLRKEIKRLLELLALSRREEAKERLALKRAVIDRRIIEKYKDNQKLAWRTELLKEEQNNMEELAALAKARRGLESDDASSKINAPANDQFSPKIGDSA
ncbi:MAG: flagellar export protein FliJ [Deltaproteobacteria bacterium]|jgi:flagellar export protein FliJ|nr:flagellar export protein FliJ [Deltaproteobacteria bacterium]